MKNLFLSLVFFYCASTSAFCQSKINTDDLIGYWKPDSASTQLFFWKDVNGELQVQEIIVRICGIKRKSMLCH